MATKKKIAAQSEDNYELPSVNPKAEVSDAPKEVIPNGDIDVALEDALTFDSQPGTLQHEINFVINRFNGDREGRKAEVKYRLECLLADAEDAETDKIAAILAAL